SGTFALLYAKINVKSNHFLFLTSLESPLHKGGSEGVWKYRWLRITLQRYNISFSQLTDAHCCSPILTDYH
ncbi:hypothetical protein, partial [Segatella copri]|uniref:hypothetical protein n=1 Tax=Segatella copri TaxID=165179 RepID=UPI001C472C0B